ncbi:MAG TPA: efflux RND transporter periplasmic adaptor subunit [Candidatus Krumholzibacteria bacterium]|nr:efflux RND transporter periplasmic adaptor subunit [Candidatus Krumholzibacteria bacterium]
MAIRNTVNIAAAALLLAGLGLAGCGSDTQSAAQGGKEVHASVVDAVARDVPDMITATGGVEAATSAMISTRMMGWVKQVHVQAGERVKKGDRLVTIDDSDLRARKAQAEAGIAEAKAVLANAETMVGRFERLYAEKSVSKAQYDEVVTGRDRAAAGLAMAEAGLREVNVHLSYLDIVAPADGLVARRMIEPGNMANPGMPLIILEDADQVKIVAHVGEKDVSSLSAGMPITVDVTSLPGAVFETTIDRVVPTANPGSRTYDVEAYLDNASGRLKSGMFARVAVPAGTRRAVLVPEAAVVRRGQLTGVWTVDAQGLAALRWVRIGRAQDGMVEVLSGLSGGESLVAGADAPLAEGDKVVTQR